MTDKKSDGEVSKATLPPNRIEVESFVKPESGLVLIAGDEPLSDLMGMPSPLLVILKHGMAIKQGKSLKKVAEHLEATKNLLSKRPVADRKKMDVPKTSGTRPDKLAHIGLIETRSTWKWVSS